MIYRALLEEDFEKLPAYPHAARWAKLHSAFGAADYGAISWILSLYAVGVFTSGLRDLAASRKLARTGERLPA